MTEHVLILFFTCSQYHNLHRILAQLVHHTGDQIEALLIRQPGYNSDGKTFGIFIQTQLFLKRNLILDLFFPKVDGIIMKFQAGIRCRIKRLPVNAIDNPSQIILSGSEKAI